MKKSRATEERASGSYVGRSLRLRFSLWGSLRFVQPQEASGRFFLIAPRELAEFQDSSKA